MMTRAERIRACGVCVMGVLVILLTARGAAAKLPPGAACTNPGQCATNFCVDGVCCKNACEGICRYCALKNTAGTVDGVCRDVPNNTDPRHQCSSNTAACAGTCIVEGTSRRCGFPGFDQPCGFCRACNGNGKCNHLPMNTAEPGCPIGHCSLANNQCRTYTDVRAHCIGPGACGLKWSECPPANQQSGSCKGGGDSDSCVTGFCNAGSQVP